ncbi:putative ABC-type sulfate transporter [Dioscorea sansibarensis]
MAWPTDLGRMGSSRRALMAASFRADEEEGDYSFMYSDKDPRWVELESLPTPDRARKGIILDVSRTGQLVTNEVDVRRLKPHLKKALMGRILADVDEDNEQFLRWIKGRYERVGMELPKIEVRFQELSVEGKVYVGSRALPTLLNSVINFAEGMAGHLGLFTSKKKVHKILHSVSGIIKPSRMTLLLGPPGSGKTTLLRSLAGMPDRKLMISGRLTYCGRDLSEVIPQRISSYINQHDMHISEMTVRETLDFSGQCSGVGGGYEMLLELLRREKAAAIKPDPDTDAFMKATAMSGQKSNLVTDYLLKVIGLDICADTILGDEMRRGVSGGEKKRVTTGEMLAGPNRTLFMDDISTGLDSSTTFQIVKFVRQMVHVMDGTVLMSLLQPAPEVFELFDDIILLSEGHIVYQGPREHVLDFFDFMGFRCPERKGIADFLQEVTSKKDQDKYWFNVNQQPFSYISAPEFAESFKTFHVGRYISDSLSIPYDQNRAEYNLIVKETTNKYGISNWKLFKACFSREWLLMKRNSFVYIFKTFQISIMSVIAMSVFLRSQMHHRTIADGTKYINALFYGLTTVMFNGMSEIVMTIERLPVFYKQRDFLFFPSWAFALPYIILRIPISLLESGIWMLITYYPMGFAPAASRFFRQFLALFLIHQMSLSMCRFIAAAGRNVVNASTYGNFFMLLIFVLGGFIISKGYDANSWWAWGIWVSPMSYGQDAISVNEFLDPRWSTPNTDPRINEPTVGKALLKVRGIFTENYIYWISIGAILGFAMVFNTCFVIFLKILNPIGNFHAAIVDEDAEDKEVKEKSSNGNQRQNMSDNNTSSKIISSGKESSVPMILPFQPLSLTFSNVNYYVDIAIETKSKEVQSNRLQLLSNVSGSIRPGVLTALVGVSGAGKTTLLDVLAGRKTQGYIEGCINVSGYPKKQESFARVSGYCEQFDIHSPYVTVYESLLFSAWLRLAPKISQKQRKMFVEEVMELVELNTLRNALVGSPGVDGLSTEQRKRLTIAVELVANPSIIFMDEPTTGLDARSAAIVMRTVRNTVDSGRSVLCTIHQPSIDIFESFDELMLMKTGGKLIYSGPLGQHSQNLIDYFEAIPGVPKIREGQNPATWVLELSSSEAQLNIDFAELYSSSPRYKRNEDIINELNNPAPGSKDLKFPTKYAQNFVTQSIACFWKQRQSYWRNTKYNSTRIISTIVYGLMFGTMFWNKGSKITKQQDLFNLLGGIYSAVFFLGAMAAYMVQPVIATERAVLYREKAAGMYSSLSYAFAQVSIEMVYVAAQSLIYTILLFSMMNFGWQADKFFWFLYFTFMCFVYFVLFGMMLMAMTPNIAVASIVYAFFNCLWNLFSGFIIPRSLTPIWWRWYYWVCPVFWTIYGLVVSQVGDKENLVVVPGQANIPVKDLLNQTLGFQQSFLGYMAVLHLAFVLIFFCGFVYCIKFLNYQNR